MRKFSRAFEEFFERSLLTDCKEQSNFSPSSAALFEERNFMMNKVDIKVKFLVILKYILRPVEVFKKIK